MMVQELFHIVNGISSNSVGKISNIMKPGFVKYASVSYLNFRDLYCMSRFYCFSEYFL